MTAPPLLLGDSSQFSLTGPYFAYAAISPISRPVRDRLQEAIAHYSSGGLAGFMWSLPLRTSLKERIARLIGASAEDLALMQSTSAGIVSIARSIRFQPGERIALFEGEFPANVSPWRQVARQKGLEIDLLSLAPFERSVEEGLASLEESLRRGVRLVAISAVQFQTGFLMPVQAIGALCHQYGAELFVDGIQAFGAVPLSVENVDYLACGSHKWSLGIEGAGFVYVAKKSAEALDPMVGWLGLEDPLSFLFEGEGYLKSDAKIRQEAGALELGTQSGLSLLAWEAALGMIEGAGVANIFAHIESLLSPLEEALLELGFVSARRASGKSATLSVRHPSVDILALHSALGEAGIVTTTPDGYLRFAPHGPTSAGDVELLIRTIREGLSA